MTKTIQFNDRFYSPEFLKDLNRQQLADLHNEVARSLDLKELGLASTHGDAVKRTWAMLQKLPQEAAEEEVPAFIKKSMEEAQGEAPVAIKWKKGDRVEFRREGPFKEKDGSRTEFKITVGTVTGPHKSEGFYTVNGDEGGDWMVRGDKLQASTVPVPTAAETRKAEAEKAAPAALKGKAKKAAAAPEPKERKKRGMRFVFPVTDEVKEVRAGTNRGILVTMLKEADGATFEECLSATWGKDVASGKMTQDVAVKTCYEAIRLLHYYVGYGMTQDAQGRIKLKTK